MTKTPDLVRIFGTTEAVDPPQRIIVGPLRVELKGGNLGAITYQGVEVLRGISYLVRDENWGTCPAKISKIARKKSKGRLQLSYTAKVSNGESRLFWKVGLVLTPDGLEFTAAATPNKDFKTNRTGFVVLHPVKGVAGKSLAITHVDGTVTHARFPKFISPGQPFLNIRALEHRPAAGLRTRIELRGPKFEMEDQRNWGDASFKTYVGSLLDPWPYVLKAGQTFIQSVSVRIEGVAKRRKVASKKPSTPKLRLPLLGLAISPDDAHETLKHIKQLNILKPDFLTYYCDATTSHRMLETYAKLADETRLPVTVELVLPGKIEADGEVGEFATALAAARLVPSKVVVTQAQDLKSFQPSEKRPWGPSYEDMAEAARKHFPQASIGGGMISYFTELNRKPPPQGVFDFITHCVCPIVHDASDTAVMQTIETLPYIFASAKVIIGNAPYHLGPTTIAARMNPYGAGITPNPKNHRVCLAPNDPRQFGTFAVSWNKGVIEAAARAGIASITLGGLCGPRGMLDENWHPTPLFRFVRSLRTRKKY